jgi:very-short-patch-repair endonuclease
MATPTHFTREHQRKARRSVSSESCARNGRLGARATIQKHGFAKFFESWRKWKLAHPSKPEKVIISILDDLNLAFDREWRLQPSFLTLDFYFESRRKGIEFHGRIHGQLKQEQREENDAKKRELLAQAGIECLWIEHTEMDERAALARKIRAFLIADAPERTPAVIERDFPF